MNKVSRYALYCLFILVIQAIFSQFIYLSPYVLILLSPCIILRAPLKFNSLVLMIIAFFLGIIGDIMTNTLIGINSFSLIIIAALRNPILKLTYPLQKWTLRDSPSLSTMGVSRYSLYVVLCYILFTTSFSLLDTMFTGGAGYNILRILVSTGINSLIVISFGYIQYKR